jgi:hypothetical protein
VRVRDCKLPGLECAGEGRVNNPPYLTQQPMGQCVVHANPTHGDSHILTCGVQSVSYTTLHSLSGHTWPAATTGNTKALGPHDHSPLVRTMVDIILLF